MDARTDGLSSLARFARLGISRASGEMRRFAGVFILIPNPGGPRETSGEGQGGGGGVVK